MRALFNSGASRSLLVCLLALGALPPADAQGGAGDLTVTPTRLVFEGRIRTQSISLIHRGSGPMTYRVEMIEQRMLPDGGFEAIAEPRPGESPASELVRYSPRRVTLEPGVAQTVRLALRKPAGLEAGEYRSHLALYAEPPPGAAASIEGTGDGEELGVRLIPIYRITVPVIVRHGELDATASLEILGPPELGEEEGKDGTPRLPLRLDRDGARSIFGDLDVTLQRPGAAPLVVAQVKGLAVYTPNPSRFLGLPLHLPPGAPLDGARLEVRFAEKERAGAATAAAAWELER